MDFIEKLFLSTLVLGAMTVLVVTFYKNKDDIMNINEKKIVDELIENFSNNKKESEYEPYEKQKEGFQASIIEGLDIGKEIIKGLTKPFQPVIDFFNDLKRFCDTLPGRFKSFANAFKDLGYGLGNLFYGVGKSLEMGVPDIFNVIGSVGKCAVKRIVNFKTCVIWYIMECIGATIYAIFVGLPIFALKFCTGIDLQPYVDIIFCYLEELDVIINKNYCFHIIHFPDWVIEKCYNCGYRPYLDKLNVDFNLNVGDDGEYINPAPEGTIPYYLNKPKQNFADAGDDFYRVLYP
jgi:hypothetical protein